MNILLFYPARITYRFTLIRAIVIHVIYHISNLSMTYFPNSVIYAGNLASEQHWYTQYMMASSNGNIFGVTGHLCGEFTGPGEFPAQRPVTRSFDVFFVLHPNKRLSKQSWNWWFRMPSRPLWRHRNDNIIITLVYIIRMTSVILSLELRYITRHVLSHIE